MDLIAHLTRQAAFSRGTFGPGTRTKGVIDHIKKELVEVEKAGMHYQKVDEWVDVVILALDGLTREIIWGDPFNSQLDTLAAAQHAAAQIGRKQSKNEKRDWPDWRTADTNGAIEHIKKSGKIDGAKISGVWVDEAFGVDSKRGSGRSTKQMKWAPHGAVFIYPAGAYDYFYAIRQRITRVDLSLMDVSDFWADNLPIWDNLSDRCLVLDHAAGGGAWLRKRVDQHNDKWALKK